MWKAGKLDARTGHQPLEAWKYLLPSMLYCMPAIYGSHKWYARDYYKRSWVHASSENPKYLSEQDACSDIMHNQWQLKTAKTQDSNMDKYVVENTKALWLMVELNKNKNMPCWQKVKQKILPLDCHMGDHSEHQSKSSVKSQMPIETQHIVRNKKIYLHLCATCMTDWGTNSGATQQMRCQCPTQVQHFISFMTATSFVCLLAI